MSLHNAILGLLNYTPMSGYSIKKVFDMSINHIWMAKLSQIYRELGALEKEGYVSSIMKRQDQKPDKKVYAITKEGKKAFTDWLSEFPVSYGPARRDEFLLRIFFGSYMDKKLLVKELEDYIAMIKKYSKNINEKEIPSFAQMLSSAGEDVTNKRIDALLENESMYWRFTVKRFHMVSEAAIRWANECIKELEGRK